IITATDYSGNESLSSDKVSAVPLAPSDITPPSPPANLNVVNPGNDDGTHLDLTWTASTDNVAIAYYRVYESTSPNVSKETYDYYYQPTSNSLQAHHLTKGIRYYYKVLAIDTSGNESSLSNRAEGIPKDTRKPNTPTNLSALASDGYVSLRWDYAWDVYRWNLYRKPGINTADYEKIDYTAINSFTDYRVTNGTTYYYKIRAESYEGIESLDSNIVQAMPTVTDLPPSVPKGLAAYGRDKEITLVWRGNPESDIAGYNIYRDGTKLTPIPILQAIYEDFGLTNEISYHYEVRAVDESQNESPSSSIDVTPHPVKIKIVSINGYEPGTYYTNTKDPQPVIIEYQQEGQISYIEFKVVDVTRGIEGEVVYSKIISEPPPTFISERPLIFWDGKYDYKNEHVSVGIYEFRLVAYQVIEPVKGVLSAPEHKAVEKAQARGLQRLSSYIEHLDIHQGDSSVKQVAYYGGTFVPVYGDARDIGIELNNFFSGKGIDWFTLGISSIGLILDVFPLSWGNQNVVLSVIKNLKKALGSEIATRFGKEIHSILKNKAGFENGWKLVSFISTEMPVISKLVKTPDGMSRLGQYFVKHGDEGGNFLKKMGKIEPSKIWKKGNLDSHYQKHVIENKEFDELFGKTPSPEEYEKLSKDVIEKGKKVIYKHADDQGNIIGDRIGFFYEKEIVGKKVVFVGVNDAKETITCFVPAKGWKYVEEKAFQWAFKVDDF
ncbi:MAG: hypothetical protein AB1630_09925, partial [bacterium]